MSRPNRAWDGWLPDMDLNHDKQIQSLLCYRYTIGQTGAFKVASRPSSSRLERAAAYLRAASGDLSRSGRAPSDYAG